MAQPRRYDRIECIVPTEVAHDIELMISGKAVTFIRQAVQHGGHDEATGELKARPTGKEIVLTIAKGGKPFTTTDLSEAAQHVGVSKQAASVALHALQRDKLVKRIAPMTYQLAGNAAKIIRKNAAKITRKKMGSGETVAEKIIAFVRSKQNGSGDGIALGDISKGIGKELSTVRSQMAKLAATKRVKRVGVGMYRVAAE